MANIAGLATLCMYMHNIMVHVYPCRNEGGRPNRRLFCYIDSDHFQVPVEEVGGYRRQCSMNHLVHKKCFHWLNEYMYFLYIFSRFTWCAFLKLSCAFIPLSFLIGWSVYGGWRGGARDICPQECLLCQEKTRHKDKPVRHTTIVMHQWWKSVIKYCQLWLVYMCVAVHKFTNKIRCVCV